MLRTALGRVRLIGMIEGISFLMLLGIAMPLKYWANIPMAVTIVGSLHGLLFVLFVMAIANVAVVDRWRVSLIAGALLSSLIPFGPFVLDKKLKDDPTA
ncbi:DUF3817 domain-containing protein [Aureibacillus halotolerans]|uniref:Integral membrane protein n=1 Tax=Aureibacillus halotolerans TaxID=1508390 RepID=A0A4R6UD54_9BACI|nr:DUF3817 domain-containing protein [Aureibacillus halotolerans]TDQ42705.1 integral membrane protein [Aureibacillus halotolerans]